MDKHKFVSLIPANGVLATGLFFLSVGIPLPAKARLMNKEYHNDWK
jgi:hypothetical protein